MSLGIEDLILTVEDLFWDPENCRLAAFCVRFILDRSFMEISFSKEELLRFANIFDNAGQVLLAGLVIAPFFSPVDFSRTLVLILGMLLTLGCWFMSWWLTKETNKL